MKTNAFNQYYINHAYTYYGFSYFLGDPNNELHAKNWVVANIASIQLFTLLIQTYGKVHFENIVFENITDTDSNIILFPFNFENVTISNITLRNITGVSFGSTSDIILLNNLPQTITVIDQIHASDIQLQGRRLINNAQQNNRIQISNVVIESINISSSDYIIDTGLVNSLLFSS